MATRRTKFGVPALLLAAGGAALLWAHLGDRRAWAALRERAAAVAPGMTHDEVVAALGKPDRRASPTRVRKDEWDAYWYVAPRRLGRDREIRIDFDPDRVERVEELPYEQIPFDRADWRDSSALRRGFMIDDLLARHDLAAMDRDGIVALLGPPPASSLGESFGDLVWCLGPQRKSLFAIDNDWLVIDLAEDGRVARVHVAAD